MSGEGGMSYEEEKGKGNENDGFYKIRVDMTKQRTTHVSLTLVRVLTTSCPSYALVVGSF